MFESIPPVMTTSKSCCCNPSIAALRAAMAEARDKDEDRVREARETLEHQHREPDAMGQSAVARAADRARAHMAADDADPNDSVEVWGRRIGRALSAVAFVLLAIWLFTYLTR